MAVGKLISPEVAARVKQLMLFARTRAEGRFTGDNRSVKKGISTDFMQHRQYVPGDNLKYIDWRVYGRTSRYVVREFEDTTNLDLYLVVDASASMGFRSGADSKYDAAVQLSAILAYLMLLQKDSFGLSLVADGVSHYLKTGASRRHLMQLFDVMLRTQPAGETDWTGVSRQLLPRVRRRGLAVLISDFLAPPSAIGRTIGGFRMRNCDVIAVHLVDPGERELSQGSMTRFVDLEDGSALTVDPVMLQQAYADGFRRHSQQIREQCLHKGAAYLEVTVGDDCEAAIGAFLRHRAAALL